MIPSDHRSELVVASSPSSTSGEMYSAVPTKDGRCSLCASSIFEKMSFCSCSSTSELGPFSLPPNKFVDDFCLNNVICYNAVPEQDDIWLEVEMLEDLAL
mmetsp:Transcript_27448/g.20607  ORF Transcript_27448/g.20607 Transcript_27448/m.20607 type:complete len:100 (+) Transcript_27448:222-521(+)|eukprot:CAMPEP_0202967718 /NCGR_PEP_ID=MMETSP1396-20130829/12721_1 /ASSEMBLY_ACC=CAM_ASM_000872 /TAXON_ID= /ORGANISM="Pseudokeronopsis sp., Strain Brazil" /LENGTH=99 /DNA_ID=CAMNT_0049693131 /DNA_START=1049 /DNA_END=1348 /DNA_ORIENTATION=-